MLNGSLEFAYAQPFANALADPAFRSWVLRQTRFDRYSDGARLLDEEMLSKRGKSSGTWWRSHFSEKCRCQGCSGRETDLLAVFEAECGERFALHFEVKQPTDRFAKDGDQAGNYTLRAACWSKSAPKAVVPHSDAATALLCSERRLADYAPHAAKFGTVITFEDVKRAFPKATI